jgi:DNA polymerase III epsilon subunit-like protein
MLKFPMCKYSEVITHSNLSNIIGNRVFKLVLDIETTAFVTSKTKNKGKYPKYPKYYKKDENTPSYMSYFYHPLHIVELGYIIVDQNAVVYKEFSKLRHPENKFHYNQIISDKTGNPLNDITSKLLIANGESIDVILSTLTEDITTFDISQILVFNKAFDINVLLRECHRHKKYKELKNFLATSNNITDIMPLARKFVRSQDPNERKYNVELVYNMLFNSQLKESHRALDDVKMEFQIYQKLKELGFA